MIGLGRWAVLFRELFPAKSIARSRGRLRSIQGFLLLAGRLRSMKFSVEMSVIRFMRR